VRLPARLRLSPDARRRLAGLEPADLALVGGRVLNVFTRQLVDASVGVVAGRIAWVGDGPARESYDVGGRIIVPGLIDPHAHGDIVCTPIAFAHEAVRHGTTLVVLDAYTLGAYLDDAGLERVMDALERVPMKVLWGLRPTRDAGGPADDARLPLDRLRRLMERPGMSSTGETTAWRALLDGADERVARIVGDFVDAGLNVDGHLPGASPRTLSRLAALGITSDHEAINGDELQARVELGIWAMVRHSSLRADGRTLGREIVARGLPVDRLLLTADGVTPQTLVGGHLDTVVREVIAGGVAPVDAVRMATLHAATYLGLDAHVGSVAPGRCADLLLVSSLEEFVPERVMCDGRWLTGERPDPIDWGAMTVPFAAAPLDAGAIVRACSDAPALRMNGVIARLDEGDTAQDPGGRATAPARSYGATDPRHRAAARGTPPSYVALVTRDGRAIVGTTTRDFDVRAVATSVTATMDVLLIGRDPEALAAAYHRVVALGGGLVCPEAELALPTFGHLSPLPVPELASALEQFERAAALPVGGPPFSYRTLFLTLPALPGICLTPEGLLDVRANRLLARPLQFPPNGW
jgi:adenine deaminase